MSKPNVPDVLAAERERISKILYLSGITLPASTEAAIRSGQDATKFRLGRSDGEIAPTEETPAVASAGGRLPWSEITSRFNRRRADAAQVAEASS